MKNTAKMPSYTLQTKDPICYYSLHIPKHLYSGSTPLSSASKSDISTFCFLWWQLINKDGWDTVRLRKGFNCRSPVPLRPGWRTIVMPNAWRAEDLVEAWRRSREKRPAFPLTGEEELLVRRSSAVRVEIPDWADLSRTSSDAVLVKLRELFLTFSPSLVSTFNLDTEVHEYVIKDMRLAVIKISKGMKLRFFTIEDCLDGRTILWWLVPLWGSIWTILIFTLSLPMPLSWAPL